MSIQPLARAERADPSVNPRTCVGCRKADEADRLLRFVLVDGVVVPDYARRLPGRGAWLHDDPGCVELAGQRKGFARSFRTAVDDSCLAALFG